MTATCRGSYMLGTACRKCARCADERRRMEAALREPADNVVELPVLTRLDIPPERVLQRALEKGLAQVVIVGYDADGEEFFASSIADGGDVVWLMERVKLKLLSVKPEDLLR